MVIISFERFCKVQEPKWKNVLYISWNVVSKHIEVYSFPFGLISIFVQRFRNIEIAKRKEREIRVYYVPI